MLTDCQNSFLDFLRNRRQLRNREISYQTLLRQNTYVSPFAQPVQNRTDEGQKRSRMTVKKNPVPIKQNMGYPIILSYAAFGRLRLYCKLEVV